MLQFLGPKMLDFASNERCSVLHWFAGSNFLPDFKPFSFSTGMRDVSGSGQWLDQNVLLECQSCNGNMFLLSRCSKVMRYFAAYKTSAWP